MTGLGFSWHKWLQGLGLSVALAGLTALGASLADHKITGEEWSALIPVCFAAGLAWLKNHRPPVDTSSVPPELLELWEKYREDAEKAALAAVLAALSPTTGAVLQADPGQSPQSK